MFTFEPMKFDTSLYTTKTTKPAINDLLTKRFLVFLVSKFPIYPISNDSLVKPQVHLQPLNYIALLTFSIYMLARLNTTFNLLKRNEDVVLLRKTFSTFSISKKRRVLNARGSFFKNIGISKHLSRFIILISLLNFFYINNYYNSTYHTSRPLCHVAHSMASLAKHSFVV